MVFSYCTGWPELVTAMLAPIHLCFASDFAWRNNKYICVRGQKGMKSPFLLEIWKCFSKLITTCVECGQVELLKHMTNLNKRNYTRLFWIHLLIFYGFTQDTGFFFVIGDIIYLLLILPNSPDIIHWKKRVNKHSPKKHSHFAINFIKRVNWITRFLF